MDRLYMHGDAWITLIARQDLTSGQKLVYGTLSARQPMSTIFAYESSCWLFSVQADFRLSPSRHATEIKPKPKFYYYSEAVACVCS